MDFVQNLIANDDFISSQRTAPHYFTRDRVWNFKTAFLFICSMLHKRSQTEIDCFFSKLYQLPEEVRKVTASAFTQCRVKIKYTAFVDVFEALNSFFYANYHYKKYHGYRLIAIDGTVYTLPKTKAMVAVFGENVLSDSGKWVKAKVSFAADVLNNICAGAVIGAYREAEYLQAITLMDKLGRDNLYLFDRGYFSRLFLRDVVQSGCQFCFRVQRNACREFVAFMNSEETDIIGHVDVEGEPIQVRFTKVLLNTGEVEFLITSLFDMKRFTKEMLKELYHERWGVEEQYKDMKYAICVENFIGKNPNSIMQEFYANIITYNLSMMLCKPGIDRQTNKKKKRHQYKTNKRALLAKIKQCFVKLFYQTMNIYLTLEEIIKSVSMESVPIRENRKYPRGNTLKAKIKYHRAYVSVI